VRTSIHFLRATSDTRCLAITSAVPGEGKTLTAANIAVALVQSGTQVAIVDADLRRPALAARFGMRPTMGLTSIVLGEATLDEVLVEPDEVPGLSVLPAGPQPPNPAEVLESDAMTRTIAQLRERFDVVIIDTPPVLPVTDAAIISRKSDGILLVVGLGVVRRDNIVRTLQSLAAVDAKVHGIVINRAEVPESGSPYYYEQSPAPAAVAK
jgi:capsular exopolysaccharide synthesis family protein